MVLYKGSLANYIKKLSHRRPLGSNYCIYTAISPIVLIVLLNMKNSDGHGWDSNPDPLGPEANALPLDHRATCDGSLPMIDHGFCSGCSKISFYLPDTSISCSLCPANFAAILWSCSSISLPMLTRSTNPLVAL